MDTSPLWTEWQQAITWKQGNPPINVWSSMGLLFVFLGLSLPYRWLIYFKVDHVTFRITKAVFEPASPTPSLPADEQILSATTESCMCANDSASGRCSLGFWSVLVGYQWLPFILGEIIVTLTEWHITKAMAGYMVDRSILCTLHFICKSYYEFVNWVEQWILFTDFSNLILLTKIRSTF